MTEVSGPEVCALFGVLSSGADRAAEEVTALDPSLAVLPENIHLRNSHFAVGDNLLPDNTGVLWRGRLEHVQGWNIGSMSRAQ